MDTAADLRARGLELTRAETTDEIVKAFGMTDALLTSDTPAAERDAIYVARGWMIEVLDERDELARIGFVDPDAPA